MPLDIKKNCLFEKILTQDTIAEHNFCLKNSDLFLLLHHVEKINKYNFPFYQP